MRYALAAAMLFDISALEILLRHADMPRHYFLYAAFRFRCLSLITPCR